LPSSFKRFHSRALVYSTHPPVSDYGTGSLVYPANFLGGCFKKSVLAVASTSPCGTRTINASLFSTHTFCRLNVGGAGILNLLSIAYALRPRLRSRLTPGGRAFPGKPWVYGGPEFNRPYRYSCLHSHFQALHGWLPSRFAAPRTLPYQTTPANRHGIRSFGLRLDRQSFLARSLSMSQLLRTV
jgi:hypothetical protein